MKQSFSILDHRVHVETDLPELQTRLEDIRVGADDARPVRKELTLRLTAVEGGYGIAQGAQMLARAPDPEEIIRTLHLIINQLVLDTYQGVLRIHAGAGTWKNQLFIATGNRGAGKTTLLLKLMLDGAEVHCDETVLLRDGQVQTFP
ncbi:MAG: hypothetical protein NTV49_08850, partial [Kiritimatiellaeota bacterium]|nr:hypothetical protein [Kiritimatiellota bacterium]